MHEVPSIMPTGKIKPIIPVFFMVFIFVFVLTRTAWLCDDAYITFRTVDNFTNGYGLTWNPLERVQSYTHPLWMFLLSAVYFFTQEIYFTSLIVSILVSVFAVLIFSFGIAATPTAAILGITVFIGSKSFMDYSTSGLENPLTHLIVAIFLAVWFKSKPDEKTLFMLSVVAAFGFINRVDTILFFTPVLIYSFFSLRGSRRILVVTAGFAPVIVWELFSLFYYGFLFPNTAYAKLNTGIPQSDLIVQGFYYYWNSIQTDPITLLIIISAVAFPFVTRQWRHLAISAGILLSLVYIVNIGGDFMSGRFFSLPLFCAVSLLGQIRFASFVRGGIPAFAAIVLIGSFTPYPPILSGNDFGLDMDKIIDDRGVADERGSYYRVTGLLGTGVKHGGPSSDWVYLGKEAKRAGIKIRLWSNVGFAGYYAGQGVHFVDELALTDPLLARLPIKDHRWRVGHFTRPLPAGYLKSLETGVNHFVDRNLSQYYEKLTVITRSPLFSLNRLIEIWRMNTGKYDRLIDRDFYFSPPMQQVTLSELQTSRFDQVNVDWSSVQWFYKKGIRIDLEKKVFATRLTINLKRDEGIAYQIKLYNGSRELAGATRMWKKESMPKYFDTFELPIESQAAKIGYDAVEVIPINVPLIGIDNFILRDIRLYN